MYFKQQEHVAETVTTLDVLRLLRTTLIALGCSHEALAQSPTWLTQLGTSGVDAAYAVTATTTGDFFAVGTMASPGLNGSGWAAKYDQSGAQVWTQQLPGQSVSFLSDCAPDSSGGVVAVGGSHTGSGALVRFDGQGAVSWTQAISLGGQTGPRALADDGAGGWFAVGQLGRFCGGAGCGSYLGWVARFDAAGNQIWSVEFQGANSGATACCPDGAGGVFVAGYSEGTVAAPNAGGPDAVVWRLDSSGAIVWSYQIGMPGVDVANAVESDIAGGIVVCGETRGPLVGPLSGASDAWMIRFDNSGQVDWQRQFGTSQDDWAYAVAHDGWGGAYVAGSTQGSLFAPNPNGGVFDAWICHYNRQGQETWCTQFGTVQADLATAAAGDGVGGLLLGGITEGQLGGASYGQLDVWLARYPFPSESPITY